MILIMPVTIAVTVICIAKIIFMTDYDLHYDYDCDCDYDYYYD